MKILVLTALALLIVSLAGLEMVTSALPDEPITPAEIRGFALPGDGEDANPLLCDSRPPFAPFAPDAGASGY